MSSIIQQEKQIQLCELSNKKKNKVEVTQHILQPTTCQWNFLVASYCLNFKVHFLSVATFSAMRNYL